MISRSKADIFCKSLPLLTPAPWLLSYVGFLFLLIVSISSCTNQNTTAFSPLHLSPMIDSAQ